MATLNRNTARLIVMSVCVAIIALLSLSDTWPLWAQGAVAALVVVALPLLNSLGVLEALSPHFKNMPGSRWNPRYMFTSLAALIGALAWVWALVRVVPDSAIGMAILLVPALFGLGASALLMIKSISGR
jgi:hypothetical protein